MNKFISILVGLSLVGCTFNFDVLLNDGKGQDLIKEDTDPKIDLEAETTIPVT